MPITRRFTVYTNAGVSVPPVIHVNQYDRGETWIFTLLEPDGSKYSPASGGIVGIKADGHAIINTATVNSNGEVVVSETQQMTAAAGKAVYEIIFDNSTHGTANFIVCVEPKPGDNATLSDSDLSLIQEAIDSTIPANIEASVQDWMDDNLAPAEWVIDNTLSIAGAAADAKKVGDVTSELKTNFTNYIYGVNETFTVEGGRINKFPLLLINGEQYTVTNNSGVAITVLLYKADGTSTTITGQLVANASITFTVDSDDYTQIGGWVNADPTGGVSVTGGINSKQILDDAKETKTIVEDVTEKKNFQEPVTDYETHADEFFANGAGTAANGWAWYKFPVSNGDSYTIHTAAGYSARAWILLNANSGVLAYDSYNQATKVDDWIVNINNANAAFLVVNCQTTLTTFSAVKNITNGNAINNNRIIIDGQDLETYLNQFITEIPHDDNILYGKTLVCCGDSITYGADMTGDELVTPTIESYQYSAYTKRWTRWTASEPAAYGYQIAERNKMVFYNGGVSGACVQGSGGTSTVPGFSVTDGEYTLLPDDIDYLTLFFGWNDTAFGTLGTINDTTNASYYGAYNVVLPYLIDKYPYAKIALIVPFGTDVGHRQAIRDLADKWGLACFDMMQGGTPLYWNKEANVNVDPSIVSENRLKFSVQANSPHPNIHGHYQISTMLEAFLRGI